MLHISKFMDGTNDIEMMEEQLQRWGKKLDELGARAEAAGHEAEADGRKYIEELRSKQLAARAKLDEYLAAGGDKWATFEEGIKSAWGELETAFEKLKN